MTIGTYPQTVLDRFWPKVDIRGPDECWPWLAGCTHNGYGHFFLNGKTVKAHRVSYCIEHGQLPTGIRILHRCDNPPCCNPGHLWPGSVIDNNADREQKGRGAKGEHAGASVLLSQQVIAIRNDPRSQRKIAADYGICKSTVGNIKRGNYWSHLQ